MTSERRDRRIRSCSGNLTVASKPVNVVCVCMCVCVCVCVSSLAQAFEAVQGEVISDDFLMLS